MATLTGVTSLAAAIAPRAEGDPAGPAKVAGFSIARSAGAARFGLGFLKEATEAAAVAYTYSPGVPWGAPAT